MKKAAVPILVAVILLTVAVVTEAQQPKKVQRIGYLSNSDPANESTRSEAIRLALRERGYIAGQNIAIEYRYAEGKQNRYPEIAAELVRLKVDIIVVGGGGNTQITYPRDVLRLLRLSYDRNGKQYYRNQDWHRSLLHLPLIRELI